MRWPPVWLYLGNRKTTKHALFSLSRSASDSLSHSPQGTPIRIFKLKARERTVSPANSCRSARTFPLKCKTVRSRILAAAPAERWLCFMALLEEWWTVFQWVRSERERRGVLRGRNGSLLPQEWWGREGGGWDEGGADVIEAQPPLRLMKCGCRNSEDQSVLSDFFCTVSRFLQCHIHAVCLPPTRFQFAKISGSQTYATAIYAVASDVKHWRFGIKLSQTQLLETAGEKRRKQYFENRLIFFLNHKNPLSGPSRNQLFAIFSWAWQNCMHKR